MTMKGARSILAIISLILLGWLQSAQPLPVASLQPAGQTLTLAEYWQRVQETRTLVEQLADKSPALAHVLLVAPAARWEQATAVILPDGTHIPVDHTFLVAQLRADPPDIPNLDQLLGNLLAARNDWPKATWSAADMAVLDSILARPEFQWQAQEQSALARWWEQAREWVRRLLQRLIPDTLADAPIVRYVLTALGILALGAALFYGLRGVLAGLVTEKSLGQDEAAEEDLTAATALKRAELLAGGGDYRAAVRYLYLSALLLLEENGLLRYDRSLTNREYLRSVASFPELAAALRRVVEIFERVWYGYQPLDEAAYNQYADWVAELQRLR
jgi:hypothetical protein